MILAGPISHAVHEFRRNFQCFNGFNLLNLVVVELPLGLCP